MKELVTIFKESQLRKQALDERRMSLEEKKFQMQQDYLDKKIKVLQDRHSN